MSTLWPPFSRPEACATCPRRAKSEGFVPGAGAIPAKVMVIMEQPGKNEVEQGIPAVGKSGWELNDALGGKVAREAAFVTNVRKCLGVSKDDKGLGIEHCAASYLQAEIDAVKPEVIIMVGADAAQICVGRADVTVINGSVYTAAEAAAMREIK